MTEKKTGSLAVPGASLYYEIFGAGPTLLMISPGLGDCGFYTGVAEILSDEYLVLTYDRRGNSRSSPADQDEPFRVETQTEDARHILEAFGDAPASVFGGSGGATITLDLTARHPQLVHTAIAHEPPLIRLLPEAADPQAAFEGLGDELTPFASYVPDLAALRRGGRRIVVGGGATSGGHRYPYRGGLAVSELLETEFVVFPGDHSGYADRPKEFAEKLRQVLRG